MSLVPRKKQDRIAFFEARVAKFAANATAIGTTTAAVTDLATKTTAARAAYEAQLVAQAAAKSAVDACDQAIAAMFDAGMTIIEQVRTKARSAGDGVYPLADLPVPAIPGPVGKPGLAYQLKAELKPNGSLEFSWKCDQPPGCTGVINQVYRKVLATGEYTYLGGAGQRTFVDATVPAGVPSVMYLIQGTRSSSIGDAAEFVVNFGVSSGGTMTATVSNAQGGTPAKIAA